MNEEVIEKYNNFYQYYSIEDFDLLLKENQQLKSQLQQRNEVIEDTIKFVLSLSSKGRDCMIYADVKKDILSILNKYKGDSNDK